MKVSFGNDSLEAARGLGLGRHGDGYDLALLHERENDRVQVGGLALHVFEDVLPLHSLFGLLTESFEQFQALCMKRVLGDVDGREIQLSAGLMHRELGRPLNGRDLLKVDLCYAFVCDDQGSVQLPRSVAVDQPCGRSLNCWRLATRLPDESRRDPD